MFNSNCGFLGFIGSNYVRVSNMELALTSIVRRENPSWTEVQIRAMLPTLHAQMQEQVARGDLSVCNASYFLPVFINDVVVV